MQQQARAIARLEHLEPERTRIDGEAHVTAHHRVDDPVNGLRVARPAPGKAPDAGAIGDGEVARGFARGSSAVVLAALGLYSVLAFAIAQRQQEMGLRLPLGATRAHVVRLVVAEGMLAPLAGLLVGVTVAYTAAPFVQPMLFSTDARALATYLGVALAVALASLLACLSPARRATITDPIIAMRSD